MAKIQAAGELTLKRMSEEMEREVNKVKIKTEW